jgi:hypothetical protein
MLRYRARHPSLGRNPVSQRFLRVRGSLSGGYSDVSCAASWLPRCSRSGLAGSNWYGSSRRLSIYSIGSELLSPDWREVVMASIIRAVSCGDRGRQRPYWLYPFVLPSTACGLLRAAGPKWADFFKQAGPDAHWGGKPDGLTIRKRCTRLQGAPGSVLQEIEAVSTRIHTVVDSSMTWTKKASSMGHSPGGLLGYRCSQGDPSQRPLVAIRPLDLSWRVLPLSRPRAKGGEGPVPGGTHFNRGRGHHAHFRPSSTTAGRMRWTRRWRTSSTTRVPTSRASGICLAQYGQRDSTLDGGDGEHDQPKPAVLCLIIDGEEDPTRSCPWGACERP